jgi:hypothetical protein
MSPPPFAAEGGKNGAANQGGGSRRRLELRQSRPWSRETSNSFGTRGERSWGRRERDERGRSLRAGEGRGGFALLAVGGGGTACLMNGACTILPCAVTNYYLPVVEISWYYSC